MAGRTLISYDDIVPSGVSQASTPVIQTQSALPSNNQKPQPQQGNVNHVHFDPNSNSNGPPSKKRKRNNHNKNNRNSNQDFGQGHQNGNPGARGKGRGNGPQQPRRGQSQMHPGSNAPTVQHWDDPGQAGASVHYEEPTNAVHDEGEGGLTTVVLEDDGEEGWGDEGEYYDEDFAVEAEEDEEDEEESRELTHTEIWDDSALIDAWESAAAEYEAFNGKGKSWKDEPVKKWYNVPPSPSKLKPSKKSANGEELQDSKPLNFESFVPQHDPSLVVAPELSTSQSQPEGSVSHAGTWASRDDSFKRALEATYWAGYWTAVYHSYGKSAPQAQDENEPDENEGEDDVEQDEEGDAEEDDSQDFMSTQR